jgi:hypothetical protein
MELTRQTVALFAFSAILAMAAGCAYQPGWVRFETGSGSTVDQLVVETVFADAASAHETDGPVPAVAFSGRQLQLAEDGATPTGQVLLQGLVLPGESTDHVDMIAAVGLANEKELSGEDPDNASHRWHLFQSRTSALFWRYEQRWIVHGDPRHCSCEPALDRQRRWRFTASLQPNIDRAAFNARLGSFVHRIEQLKAEAEGDGDPIGTQDQWRVNILDRWLERIADLRTTLKKTPATSQPDDQATTQPKATSP